MTRGLQPRPSETEIRSAIETAVRERFAADDIASVDIAFGEDMDGSDVVDVRVVFAVEKLDPKTMLSIGTALRFVLHGMGETAFPLVSIVSATDLSSRRASGAR